MKVSILGTGLTGLILGYVHKKQGDEVKLYGAVLGGQHHPSQKYFPLGPRILHSVSPLEETFLKELGIDVAPREFKIGYMNEDEIYGKATLHDLVNYNLKTRGNKNPEDSALSGGKSSIIGWDIDEIKLVEVLYAKLKDDIIIESFDCKERIFELYNSSDKIYCTFAYHKLYEILEGHLDLDKKPTQLRSSTFVRVSCREGLDNFKRFDKRYDYIYDTRGFNKIKRITKLKDYSLVIEIMVDSWQRAIEEITRFGSGKLEIHELKIIRNIIPSSYHIPSVRIDGGKPIYLEGRFARLDHAYKVSTTIEEYYKV